MSGDAAGAWDLFLDRYRGLITSTVRKLVRDPEERVDAFAAVCTALCEHGLRRLTRFTLDGPARFSTWLVVVIRNLVVDHYRHERGRSRHDLAQDGLSATHRAVYQALAIQGMTYAEAFESLASRGAFVGDFRAFLGAVRELYGMASERAGPIARELIGVSPVTEPPAQTSPVSDSALDYGRALEALATLPVDVRLVDPASVTSGTVRLAVNGRAQDVDLSVRDEGTVVVVSPRAPLTPSSDYTLEIDTGIQDLTGDHLARSEVVPFATSSIVPTGGEPFGVRILPDTLRVPVNATSGFVVLVDSGARLINVFPDPSVTWRSTDPAIVRSETSSSSVDALAIGQAWVTAEYRGQVDSALVIVTTSPPPGPFSVFPDAATAPVGHRLTFDVRLPDTSPRPATTWSTTNPGIVAITAAGVATMVGPGTAFVVASDGSTTDSAEVEVYDPTPPLGWLYAIVPESTLLQVGDLWQMQLVGPGDPLPPVTWNTADPAIATIDAQGLLRAATPGTVLVTATFTDGSADSATVRVVPAGSLGRISLQPQSATAAVGDTVRLTLVYDSTATAMFGGQPFTWTVRSVGGPVLRILSGGVFEAIGPGTAEIRAYVGPLFTQTVTVVVSP